VNLLVGRGAMLRQPAVRVMARRGHVTAGWRRQIRAAPALMST